MTRGKDLGDIAGKMTNHFYRRREADNLSLLDIGSATDGQVLTADGSGAAAWESGLNLDGVPDHDHSGDAGDGGQLDWDDIWSDAVHTHTAAGEGGLLEADEALLATGITDGYVLTAVGDNTVAWEASPGLAYSAGDYDDTVQEVTGTSWQDHPTVSLSFSLGSAGYVSASISLTFSTNFAGEAAYIRLEFDGVAASEVASNSSTSYISYALNGSKYLSSGAHTITLGMRNNSGAYKCRVDDCYLHAWGT